MNQGAYIIDMDEVMRWVHDTDPKNNSVTTTTFTYDVAEADNSNELVQKEISDSKSNLNETVANIKYDFFKILLLVILQSEATNLADFDVTERLAFDSLTHNNLIKEIESND